MRSTFHFKVHKKSFPFRLFINGGNTGGKVSPEAAHQEILKYFQAEDYCTSKQIRSLFSRWLRQKSNGSLKEVEKDTSEDGKKLVKFIA